MRANCHGKQAKYARISLYRPINLLLTFSKVFEKIFLSRLSLILNKFNIITEHKFGFRHKHCTPERWCHCILSFIRNSLERKDYFSGVFLDIQQAFDKAFWHIGLLFQLKNLLPLPCYLLLKTYLNERNFNVNVNDKFSEIYVIKAGILQGCALGPTLYTIFTSDMPLSDNVLVATYTDDTAILASSSCLINTSNFIQNKLN